MLKGVKNPKKSKGVESLVKKVLGGESKVSIKISKELGVSMG
jgi:hypothetical protein